MDPDNVHKYLIMGIIAGVSLTTFLFGLTTDDIREIREDIDSNGEHITDIKEDVGYIRGVLESWEEDSVRYLIPNP